MNNRLVIPRFLVPDLDPSSVEAVLPHDEAHHLTRVMRLGEGDEIAVFDGKGREFLARVTRAAKGRVLVRLLKPLEPAPEPRVPFTLVQAILKPDAMDGVVRDATMMGAAAIWPVVSAHVAVKSAQALRPANVDRWTRIAAASAKQCGRARVPEILAPAMFDAWLKSSADEPHLIFVEPGLGVSPVPLKTLPAAGVPASAGLIIGPEGGWAREEVEAAVKADCIPVSLGRLTLRADAMAVAAISVFRFLWES
jgi:16S rRNA (uracil1498-N3)-methyltransferase